MYVNFRETILTLRGPLGQRQIGYDLANKLLAIYYQITMFDSEAILILNVYFKA